MMRSFIWVKGRSVEVFPDPNKDRTRLFANQVFALHEEIYEIELNWDTPDGPWFAHRLLQVALDDQVAFLHDADPWREELRDIRAANTLRPGKALELLYALAWDGGGWRPEGETFGWIDRLEDQA
jgi:hypothetical protein